MAGKRLAIAMEEIGDGRSTRSASARAVRFVSGWRTVPPPYCPWHSHPAVEIVYHPSGDGWTDTREGSRILFRPGSVVVYPPHAEHTQTMRNPGEDIVVQLAIEPLPSELARPLLAEDPDRTLLADLDRLSDPPAARTPLQQAAFDHRAAGLLFELLCLPGQSGTSGPLAAEPIAERAYRLVRERFASIDSLTELTDDIGVSYDHLRHVFRTRYGITLQEWLIRTRLERARELLLHSHLPLKAIAPLCGFGTDRHLCTAFRQRFGCSPGAFRSSGRSDGQ